MDAGISRDRPEYRRRGCAHKTANISNLLAIGASSRARRHARARERDRMFSPEDSAHACSQLQEASSRAGAVNKLFGKLLRCQA